MVRFLHFADSHLGIQRYKKVDDETRENVRGLDFFSKFKEIIQAAIDLKVDFVVHGGDLFDKLRVSNRTIRQSLEELKPLSEKGIPFITIAGNHDRPQSRTADSPIRLLGILDNVFPIPQAGTHSLQIGNQKVCIHGISYWGKDPPKYIPQRSEKLLRNERGDINILLVHQTIEGSILGGEKTLAAFTNETPVSPRSIPNDYDYIATGHIHKKQVFTHPNNPSLFIGIPGSAERVDFSERNDPKGFFIVEGEKGNLFPEFQELETRNMVEILLKMRNPTIQETREMICDELQKKDLSEKIVGIRLEGEGDFTVKQAFHPRHLVKISPKVLDIKLYPSSKMIWLSKEGERIELGGQWIYQPVQELDRAIEARKGLRDDDKIRLKEKGSKLIRELCSSREES